jgi:hypothetical protein
VVPLVEVLGIPLHALAYIQPLAVLATALVQLGALSPLVQSHLHSGCLEWCAPGVCCTAPLHALRRL